jgi:pimeloyl-ACP methyl ester carboxylesterase
LTLIVNRSRRIIDNAESDPAEFWPVRDLLARGYATAAFHYGDAALDSPHTSLSSGVFTVFGPPETERPDDAWGAVSAWAWAASRAIDFLEIDERLKDAPLALVGHSRGGKAALWCGAQDSRIALTISNNSGCTGAALARTTRGETIQVINEKFPHWFAANYKTFAAREAELPVDQHELIALIAPRRVYVASSSEDANADPLAEFMACVEAGPVFALHGRAGVGSADFPAIGEARHAGAIGYHLRAGEHDLTREDWARFMDYADSALAPRR